MKSTDGGRQCGFAERWILSAIQFIFKMNEHIHYFHSYVFANRQIQPGMLSGDKQLRTSIIIIIIIILINLLQEFIIWDLQQELLVVGNV